METNKELCRAAIEYLERGYSVLPLHLKSPASGLKWGEYQKRIPEPKEVEHWFTTFGDVTGIGIVTGAISDIVVLDVEAGQDMRGFELPLTLTARSGSGGYHYYFRYPSDRSVSSTNLRVSLGIEADLKSDGGYVAAPPSLHESGNHYEWVCDEELADLPEWLLPRQKECRAVRATGSEWSSRLAGVPEGQRHTTATQIIGKLLSSNAPEFWETLWPTIVSLNQKNRPPLGERELRGVFDSLARKETEKIEKLERKSSEGERHKETPFFLSTGDLLALDFSAEVFVVESLIPHNGITAISGHPGHGKSWFLLVLAESVASGTELFERYAVRQSGVLIVDEENGLYELQRRAKMLRYAEGLPVYFSSVHGLKLDQEESQKRVCEFIRQHNIGLVMIDPFVAIHSGGENDAGDIQRVMDVFQKINSLGAAVVYAHHHRKTGGGEMPTSMSMRGSSALVGRADSHLVVSGDDDGEVIKITHAKSRRGKKAKAFELNLVDIEGGYFALQFAGETYARKREFAEDLVLEALSESENALDTGGVIEAVQDRGDVGVKAIRNALNNLYGSHRVTRVQEGRRRLWSLREDSDLPF